MTPPRVPSDRRIPGYGPEYDVFEIIESYVGLELDEEEYEIQTVDATAATLAVFDYLRDNGLLRDGA